MRNAAGPPRQTGPTHVTGPSGFTVVELIVALALTLIVAATVAATIEPARASFAAELERGDLQQRLRVGVDTLVRDVMSAGAGSTIGGNTGPLANTIAVVMPFQRGATRNDPPGTFARDTITTIGVPATAAQTTLAADLPAGASTLRLMPTLSCDIGVNLCGFTAGMTLLIYDASGAFDLVTARDVHDGALQIDIDAGASNAYADGAAVVEARVQTYSLRGDRATESSQLVHNDGSNADAPVLDHVADLAFEYAGDGDTRIAASDLVDGPWLPGATAPLRWDADLRRIRTIRVTLRLEAAIAALRGPAGRLFRNAGTAASPHALVPDSEVRFEISPRNLTGVIR
jgi:Tfp pilus assembly protein PilW